MIRIIHDTLETPAIPQLQALTISERKNAVIATPLTSRAYLSILAYYYPAAIVKPHHAEFAKDFAEQGIKIEQPTKTITRSEARILELLLDGYGTEAIAAQVHRSAKTVNAHIANILAKEDVQSRAELIAKIYRSAT